MLARLKAAKVIVIGLLEPSKWIRVASEIVWSVVLVEVGSLLVEVIVHWLELSLTKLVELVLLAKLLLSKLLTKLLLTKLLLTKLLLTKLLLTELLLTELLLVEWLTKLHLTKLIALIHLVIVASKLVLLLTHHIQSCHWHEWLVLLLLLLEPAAHVVKSRILVVG